MASAKDVEAGAIDKDQPPSDATLADDSTQEHDLPPEKLNDELQQQQTQPEDVNDKPSNLSLNETKSIAETLSLPREIALVSLCCLAQFTTQTGLGQTLAIIEVIGQSFELNDPAQLTWLIAGYSLTVGTFILISGRFGDIFGYKRMLVIGYAWFAVWSMIAGLSVYSNHVLFVFARVLSGIGPSITLTNGLALLGATYRPGPRKAMVFSLFGACAPGGSIAGAAFAGIFAEKSWWPWTYWSFSIVLVVITILSVVLIPEPPKKVAAKTLREKIVTLDLPGATTGIIALVLINFAWNQAPIVGWQKAYVYVLLIIGILFVPVFFYIELKVAPDPLIPFSALSGDVGFVLACIACGWGAFGMFVYYGFNFLLNLRHESPLLATAHLSPVAVSGFFASVTTGFLLGRLRPATVMCIALCAFLIGEILLATAPVHQIYWAQVFLCTVIIPWGMDMSFPAATLILSDAVRRDKQGIAASLVNTVVNYSISIGLGIAGTVEVHVNNGGRTPADVLKGYRGGLYVGVGLSGLGVAVSVLFILKSSWANRKKKRDLPEEQKEKEKIEE